MATTKKFAQMSTKKLNALLETANEEDAAAINAILESRNAKQAAAAPEENPAELSEEEKQAIAAAEQEAPSDAMTESKANKVGGRKASPKMSEEELEALLAEAKNNVGHRCEVNLPGTAIRVNGTILTTLKDKRAMQVYYQVETDPVDDMESCKIYKKANSPEITILDEVVELKKKTGSKVRVAKEKMEAGEWEVEANAVREVAAENIGKTVDLDLDGNRIGRIVNLLNDKRSCGLYYRIEFTDENGVKKTCHKVINYTKNEQGQYVLEPLPGMSAELDEEGLKVNEAFQERKAREPRKMLTPEEKVLAAEEAVKKAEATLKKAKETLTMRQNLLQMAKKELEAKHDSQEALASGAGHENAEEPAEQVDDDLA